MTYPFLAGITSPGAIATPEFKVSIEAVTIMPLSGAGCPVILPIFIVPLLKLIAELLAFNVLNAYVPLLINAAYELTVCMDAILFEELYVVHEFTWNTELTTKHVLLVLGTVLFTLKLFITALDVYSKNGTPLEMEVEMSRFGKDISDPIIFI